ncbi:hypothetical protein BH20ACI2_BH20ACI2_08520 [soil metagenome]
MPYVFAWFTLAKGYGKTARAISLGWMGFFVLVNAIVLTSTPPAARPSSINSNVASTTSNAVTNTAIGDTKTTPVPAPTVDEKVVKNRVARGEQIFKRIQAGSGLPLMFGWQAKDITLMVPTRQWSNLTSTQKVDLTYFMDTLPGIIGTSPDAYVTRWSAYYRRTEQLERGGEFDGLYRDGYLSNARSICSSCWSIATGTVKKDGFYDEDYPVKGSSANSFRASLDNAK